MSIRKERKLFILRKKVWCFSTGLFYVTYRVSFLFVILFFNLSDYCFRNFFCPYFKRGNKTEQLLITIVVRKEMRRMTNRATKLRIYFSFLYFSRHCFLRAFASCWLFLKQEYCIDFVSLWTNIVRSTKSRKFTRFNQRKVNANFKC